MRRTRTLLAACAVAVCGLAACAASASAWSGSFLVGSDYHASPVTFKIETFGDHAVISEPHVKTRACGGAWAHQGQLSGSPQAIRSANGPVSFHQWKPDFEIRLNFDLSHHGNEVIATGTALAAFGPCHERFDFRATSVVHGLN